MVGRQGTYHFFLPIKRRKIKIQTSPIARKILTIAVAGISGYCSSKFAIRGLTQCLGTVHAFFSLKKVSRLGNVIDFLFSAQYSERVGSTQCYGKCLRPRTHHDRHVYVRTFSLSSNKTLNSHYLLLPLQWQKLSAQHHS